MKDIQLKKQFLKAVLPSMMAFMFSGVYAIVDGFFVGRNVGDNGLAPVSYRCFEIMTVPLRL